MCTHGNATCRQFSFFLSPAFSGSGGCQRPRPSTEKRRAAKEKPKRDRRETDEQRRRTPTETVKGVKGIADGIGRNRQRHRPLHVRPAGRIASDITSFASRPSVCPSRIGQRCGRASAVNRTRFERRRISSDALWGRRGAPPPGGGGEGADENTGARSAPVFSSSSACFGGKVERERESITDHIARRQHSSSWLMKNLLPVS